MAKRSLAVHKAVKRSVGKMNIDRGSNQVYHLACTTHKINQVSKENAIWRTQG